MVAEGGEDGEAFVLLSVRSSTAQRELSAAPICLRRSQGDKCVLVFSVYVCMATHNVSSVVNLDNLDDTKMVADR